VHHPQTKAIQVLCLLSLVFGGLLWPLAWLWAYSKPVFYRMAYGEDRVEHGAGGHEAAAPAPAESREITKPGIADAAEMTLLRSRIARLERELDRRGSERGE
jgi:type 1 glutamine amidotransferase